MQIPSQPPLNEVNRRLPRLAAVLAGTSAVMIVLLPFHAFLSVWLASFVGHYTLIRLWKEVLLMLLVVGCGTLFILDARKSGRPYFRRVPPLVWLSGGYMLLLAVTGLLAVFGGRVTPKAWAYGLLLDGRFLVFFMIVWLVTRYDRRIVHDWQRLLLVPAAIVVLFGVLQLTVLPATFLTHFGYGPQTITAIQTVDQKVDYRRVQSTLRGANPLGAYLVLVLAAVAGLLRKRAPGALSDSKRRFWMALFLAAGCAVLAVTYSRAAYIGCLAAFGWLLWPKLRAARTRRLVLLAASAAVIMFGVIGYALRNNDVVQNSLFHTDEHSRSLASSNQGHFTATKAGLSDIIHQPFGAGTGTAGPASVYNNRPARIAENYFIQIGQEAGLPGLILFVAINLLLARELLRRRQAVLPRILLASLVGISIINLLSHAWTDDTLAYVWWGLAGAALAVPLPQMRPAAHALSAETSNEA